MNKSLIILTFLGAITALSCQRKTIPSKSTEIKDSTTESVTATKRDSTLFLPSQSGSLVLRFKDLQNWHGSTAEFNRPLISGGDNLLRSINDTLGSKKVAESKEGSVRTSLWLDAKGNLLFRCDTDSLKLRIQWLEWRIKNASYQTKESVIEVPKPYPDPYIPKWVWWTLGISIAINSLFFANPIKRIIQHIRKPW